MQTPALLSLVRSPGRPRRLFERIRSIQSYHIRGVAERQTRGAQNAEGIARAGSNPAASTIRRQTAPGRFFIQLNAGRKPVRRSAEESIRKAINRQWAEFQKSNTEQAYFFHDGGIHQVVFRRRSN